LIVRPVPVVINAVAIDANSNSQYVDDAPINPKGNAFCDREPSNADGNVKQKSIVELSTVETVAELKK
jgi:hypothetical protein